MRMLFWQNLNIFDSKYMYNTIRRGSWFIFVKFFNTFNATAALFCRVHYAFVEIQSK